MAVGCIAQGTTIPREHHWVFLDRTWSLTGNFSAERYNLFRALPRVDDFRDYDRLVDDPRDDGEISSVVEHLTDMSVDAGLNVWERLNLVIAFVQSLTYVGEEGEYPKYPLETLIDGKGDCEDFAILAAALLRQMGFRVVLLAYTVESHMAGGLRVLPVDSQNSQAYEWNGEVYYYVETTSPGWEIGEKPAIYASMPTIVEINPTLAAR